MEPDFNLNNIVNEVERLLWKMKSEARQRIVEKMEETTYRFFKYGEPIKSFDQIIDEVTNEMMDGLLFDINPQYPFVNIKGIEMCLN